MKYRRKSLNNYLYHGSAFGIEILESGKLFPNSHIEAALEGFDDSISVTSLTRSFDYAKYYASLDRDDKSKAIVITIDKNILMCNYKIRTYRSSIWDGDGGYSRAECEEFITKPLGLDHPAVVKFEKV